MHTKEQDRFDRSYQQHLRALTLQGMSDSTIELYAHAVRRLVKHFDGHPDQLDHLAGPGG